jgi:NADH-quinone oxidoreductase subunit B
MATLRWLDWYGDRSLVVVDVGLACCALEFDAATSGAVSLAELPAGAPVAVVVSGTVTDRLEPSVLAIVDAVERACGHRPLVVSFGACASSGGPYWDSYAVTKGVDQLVQIDRYVPGCPPTPAALREVLDELAGRVTA